MKMRLTTDRQEYTLLPAQRIPWIGRRSLRLRHEGLPGAGRTSGLPARKPERLFKVFSKNYCPRKTSAGNSAWELKKIINIKYKKLIKTYKCLILFVNVFIIFLTLDLK